MSDRLLVGTKKGLFELRHARGTWTIDGTRFLGDPISMLLHDPRDGALYAAEALGHFGVKLQRSRDGGETLAGDRRAGVPQDRGDGTERVVPVLPGNRRRRPARAGCGAARSRARCSCRRTTANRGR